MSKNSFSKKLVSFLVLGNECPLKPLFLLFVLVFTVLPPKKLLAKTDSVHKNAHFSLFLIQLVSGNFWRKSIFAFFLILGDHLKYLFFIGLFWPFSILFFFFFCFFCLQPKTDKNKKCNFRLKNAIFFSKTSFWHPDNFAKTLFWHNVTLFVFFKHAQKHYKNGGRQWKNWTSF